VSGRFVFFSMARSFCQSKANASDWPNIMGAA
jgi:hypothetical protein